MILLTTKEKMKFEAWIEENFEGEVACKVIEKLKKREVIVRRDTAVRPPTGFMGVKTIG